MALINESFRHYRLSNRMGGGLVTGREPIGAKKPEGPGLGKVPYLYGHIPHMPLRIPAVGFEWRATLAASRERPQSPQSCCKTSGVYSSTRGARIRGKGKRAAKAQRRADAVNAILVHINAMMDVAKGKHRAEQKAVKASLKMGDLSAVFTNPAFEVV